MIDAFKRQDRGRSQSVNACQSAWRDKKLAAAAFGARDQLLEQQLIAKRACRTHGKVDAPLERRLPPWRHRFTSSRLDQQVYLDLAQILGAGQPPDGVGQAILPERPLACSDPVQLDIGCARRQQG